MPGAAPAVEGLDGCDDAMPPATRPLADETTLAEGTRLASRPPPKVLIRALSQ